MQPENERLTNTGGSRTKLGKAWTNISPAADLGRETLWDWRGDEGGDGREREVTVRICAVLQCGALAKFLFLTVLIFNLFTCGLQVGARHTRGCWQWGMLLDLCMCEGSVNLRSNFPNACDSSAMFPGLLCAPSATSRWCCTLHLGAHRQQRPLALYELMEGLWDAGCACHVVVPLRVRREGGLRNAAGGVAGWRMWVCWKRVARTCGTTSATAEWIYWRDFPGVGTVGKTQAQALTALKRQVLHASASPGAGYCGPVYWCSTFEPGAKLR